MHSLRMTVLCGFWAGGVIEPFLFETDKGTTDTVNRERYRDLISTQLWPNLKQLVIDNFWFKQGGATCHTSRETLALLHEKFLERVVSLHGDKKWPPRSRHRTPCDFLLYRFVKFKVYANKPRTIF